MKNLEILHQIYKHCDFIKDAIGDECNLSDIQWTIINPYYKRLGNLEAVIVCNGRMYQVSLCEQNDIKCLLLPKYGNSKFCIVGIEYCVTVNQLYLAYESGEIVRISLKEFTHKEDVQICEHDLAIKLDTKLHCMKLSPDQEIIIVVTDEGNVITMLDFEIISEVNLHLSDFGEKQFITVGWGKKETQFHGSEGKTAARAKQEQLHVNTSDSGCPRISWREDGILFAVSFVHATTNVRQFKVFNREGVLQYTSEPTDGLEECLAWKPSGELIASTCQKYDNYGNASEHVVTCFEKNGLNHNYEQPSVGQRVIVKDLFWSPDSEILTVICKQLDTDNTELQLWTENNCTWYLKQVMIFYKDDPLIHAAWSVRASDKSYKKELILLTLRGLMYCLFTWRVNHNKCETTNDRALIGVIQGRKVLLTDFKTAIVPPPWGQTHVALKEPVNAIVFAPNGKTQVDSSDEGTWMDSSVFCTVSCSNTLTFFKKMPKRVLIYDVLNVCSIECDIPNIKKCIDSGRIHHFLWLTENSMLCIATGDSCSYLCEVILHKIGTENGRVMIRHSRKLDYDATHLVPTDDENVTYLLETHCIYVIRKNDVGSTLDCESCEELYSVERIDDEFELDEYENEVKYHQVEHARIDSKHVLVALGHSNILYVDHDAVATNITSFYVHSGFLLLTTEESLICVPLSKSGLTQLAKYDLSVVQPWNLDRNGCTETKFSEGIYMRRIERGSHIVAATPHTSKVLLQAPRGNLECIRPRPMSLHIIGRHLDERDYRTAFEIMRVERINLNFIYDHDPRSFTDNAEKFVNDIADNPSWLTLFLADLQNENVVKTMYANCSPDCSAQSATSEDDEAESNKVERVCELLRSIMEQRHDAAHLIEPILISLVKHQYKEGLERALGKVKSIKLMGNSQQSVSADDALRCLLHLVNIDVLYNIALGMYDFGLTMFIASKSSKDPKEYIPFLNNLRNLSDDNYMKYSIDMHLKRYDSALEHISKVPSKFDDECLKLIRDQKLYQSAIKLFEKSSVEHKKVAALYAEYLLTEKKHHQAGIMFYRSGDLRKALQAFSKSGCSWQEAIMVSTELKLSSADLRELYRDLVKQLQAERMYSDAATVLKDYLNDAEEAVAILCEGRIWKRAIRIALDIERLDLIETHIKPGVKEHAEDVLSKLSKKTELFLKLKSRLVSVRKEIKQKLMLPHTNDCLPLDDLIGKQIYNDRSVSRGEVMDVLSDASSDTTFSQSSQISSTSGKSYRSRKKARKQARKILCIKEGGMFEDVGLVFELHKIIDDMYKDRDETTQLVHLLMRFEFDESWNILNKTKEFFQLVKSSIPEIWNNSPTTLDKLENFMDKLSLQENIAGFNPRELSYCTKYPPEIDWKYYDLS